MRTRAWLAGLAVVLLGLFAFGGVAAAQEKGPKGEAADQMRRDLIARAEADAGEQRARAQQDIELATQRAQRELQDRVANLAIDLAEVIVKQNLDRNAQQALIEKYINQVGASS